MKAEEFKAWLEENGAKTAAGRNTRTHAVRTIETKLDELGFDYPDLDAAWQAKRFADVRDRISYLRADFAEGGEAFRILMPQSENPAKRLSNWASWLGQYGQFLDGNTGSSDADRIRRHALETYIEPAREQDDETVELVVKEVNDQLGLKEAWPNICQAMRGKKFHDLADVPPPQSFGADQSTATRFRFDMERENYWALRLLQGRFGRPIARSAKMVSFQLADGRQIALELSIAKAQVWIEGAWQDSLPEGATATAYAAAKSRHSNLPGRLAHNGADARPVTLVVIPNADVLTQLLDQYERGQNINRENLGKLKQAFLDLHPDFTNFADTPSFASNEGDYKQALVDEAKRLLAAAQGQPDAELGGALIELLAGRTELFCNLIDWHAMGVIDKARKANPGVIEAAAGALARAEKTDESVAAFVEKVWPLLRGDPLINPYAESRMLPTMLRALVDPESVLAIRSTPTDNAARALLGRPAFANAPLSREELQTVTGIAREMRRTMDEEWGWAPRHLWDVQGFIWETCQKRLPDKTDPKTEEQSTSEKARPAMPQPTNLILYGPPGTGKTYRTMTEALRYCGEQPEQDRTLLRKQYDRLREAGRIEFVTFHQNFSYEDFVEGLRPRTAEDETGGFSLYPEAGVFREIAARAGDELAGRSQDRSLAGRRFFKMSLGESGNAADDWVFEESLANGYALFSFGCIDWRDDRFSESGAILDEARRERPNEDISASSGIVQCTDMFRNDLDEGDVVVVSKGLSNFRAIGVVDGPYEYHPREAGQYCHRRKVRWLWHATEALSVQEIQPRNFGRKTIHPLGTRDPLDIERLQSLVDQSTPRQSGNGEVSSNAHQFVLIIDEINRANISKVFGELITLIEPDKRLGMPNALKVRLPYSKREFGVPANLHIIGTMNTADRSIALLDTALRRRFRFEEMAPDTSVAAFRKAEVDTGLPLGAVLNTMNKRIEYLVDRDHRIGHAFFIGCETKAQVDAVMRDKVIPLLQEYFFDDWNRLAAVLGEKDRGGNFLTCETIEDPMGEGGEPLKSWSVLTEFDEGAYARLVSGKAAPPPDKQEADPA